MPKASALAEKILEPSLYKSSRLKKRNEEVVLQYSPLIKYIAKRIAGRLPVHVDIRDMINSGVLGLMDAMEKFDPKKKVKFATYAEYRIKGAILDNLRAMDWVPRSVRKVATLLENTASDLEKKLGRPATDEELAESMNIEVERFYKMLNRVNNIPMVSLEHDSKCTLIDRTTDGDRKTPCDKLDREELQTVLADNISLLPKKEKLVISLYYFNELTMKEIGRVLKLTESRVSQIHTKAVMRLRGKLRKAQYC